MRRDAKIIKLYVSLIKIIPVKKRKTRESK